MESSLIKVEMELGKIPCYQIWVISVNGLTVKSLHNEIDLVLFQGFQLLKKNLIWTNLQKLEQRLFNNYNQIHLF